MKNSQFAKIKILQEKIQTNSRVYIGKWLDYEYYVLQWKPLNVITNDINQMVTTIKTITGYWDFVTQTDW